MNKDEKRDLARRLAMIAWDKKTADQKREFNRIGGLARGAQRHAEAEERKARKSGDPTRYYAGPTPEAHQVEDFLLDILKEHPEWSADSVEALRAAALRKNIWMLSRGAS